MKEIKRRMAGKRRNEDKLEMKQKARAWCIKLPKKRFKVLSFYLFGCCFFGLCNIHLGDLLQFISHSINQKNKIKMSSNL